MILNNFKTLFLLFKTRLSSKQPRRAIKLAYWPWAILENPAPSAANQIAPFAKTKASHIIIIFIIWFSEKFFIAGASIATFLPPFTLFSSRNCGFPNYLKILLGDD